MNGAHALLATLEANNVNVCFSNPGTSEMHFVAALDDASSLRGVLCLFEGVATGAADGFARVTGSPAATLLHLGPGLANGWANLHNARRAHVPVLNIVGDHATYHARFDAPLQSDIKSVAGSLQGWYRHSNSPNEIAQDCRDALSAAHGPPGCVATLVLPADVSWGEVTTVPPSWPRAVNNPAKEIDERALTSARAALRHQRVTLFLGGSALSKEQLVLAHRISSASSARVMCETFPTKMDRGANTPSPERLNYLSEFASAQLDKSDVIILIGAREPVGFFAYPTVASQLVREGCDVIDLAPPGSDTLGALQELADSFGAPDSPLEQGELVGPPRGELTTTSFAAAIGATLREGTIVVDESNTSGVHLFHATRYAPEHQWMTLTGGAIGYGLPVALGAAVAAKRRVLALESDGSMMYTLQTLWTLARESLDVTVVGLSNRSYAVLTMELARVGAHAPGAASSRMLELDNPTLNLAALASAQGVPSVRVRSAGELVRELQRSYTTPGPTFIEALLAKGLN